MEASKSLSCENNNISLFSALPESSNTDAHSLIKSFKPIDCKILTECELDMKHISDWMHQKHLKMKN